MLRELPLSYCNVEDESDLGRWLAECACEQCQKEHEPNDPCLKRHNISINRPSREGQREGEHHGPSKYNPF